MDAGLYKAAVEGLVDVINEYIHSLSSKVTATGNTVLHLHVGIPASKGGIPRRQFIETVLHHQRFLLLQKNENEEIPLHLAARFGHTNAVEVFIREANEMGVNYLKEMLMATDRNKDTALHHAARWNNRRIVDLLLSAHGDRRYNRNADGETPLYIAAERNHNQIVKLLVRDHNPHMHHPDAGNDDEGETPPHISVGAATISETCEGPLGRTVLHAAVLWGHEGTLNAVLENNNSLLISKDSEGQTPLHYVAGAKRKTKNPCRILTVLLQYDDTCPSAVYVQDNEGRTALHLVALYGGVDQIKTLIEHRPDCSEIRDHKGQTLFHYAAKSGCLKTIKYLMSHGILSKLVNEKDHEGSTPLHLLATFLSYEQISYFRCMKAFARDKEVDLMAFNSQNQTAGDILHQLISRNYIRPHYKTAAMSIGLVTPKNLRTPFKEKPDESRFTILAEIEKDTMLRRKKACEVHIIVATLIATVSFAAGIAVPGGFNQDLGVDQGTALLTRKAAFIAFMASDTCALTSSAISILLHFSIARLEEPFSVRFCYRFSMITTPLSLGAIMVAFATAAYATMYPSPLLLSFILSSTILFGTAYVGRLIRLASDYCSRAWIDNTYFSRSCKIGPVFVISFLCPLLIPLGTYVFFRQNALLDIF